VNFPPLPRSILARQQDGFVREIEGHFHKQEAGEFDPLRINEMPVTVVEDQRRGLVWIRRKSWANSAAIFCT
jgi:hypothetical protein